MDKIVVVVVVGGGVVTTPHGYDASCRLRLLAYQALNDGFANWTSLVFFKTPKYICCVKFFHSYL